MATHTCRSQLDGGESIKLPTPVYPTSVDQLNMQDSSTNFLDPSGLGVYEPYEDPAEALDILKLEGNAVQ